MSKGYISGLITGSLIGINAVMAGIIVMDIKGFVSLKALDPEYLRKYYQPRPAYRPPYSSYRASYNDISRHENSKDNSYFWIANKCGTCKHKYHNADSYPCYGCCHELNHDRGTRWAPIVSCETCKYRKHSAQPDGTDVCTDLCKSYSEWEPSNDEYEGGEDD